MIVINGTVLTEGQELTVHAALQNFVIDLKAQGLGDDETGKAIAQGYLARIKELNALMGRSSVPAPGRRTGKPPRL